MKVSDVKGKLDPEAEKALEAALKSVEKIKDLAAAQQLAHDALKKLQWKEKADKFHKGINEAKSVARVLQVLYNVKLAGEGLKVIK